MDEATKYKSVYAELKKAIGDGVYPADSMMPTETSLCNQFNVSRTTVRKAMAMLEHDGFVSIHQGRGTKVLNISTAQRLGNISSITETLRSKGYKVGISDMSIQKIACPDFLVSSFQLEEDDNIYMIDRLILADGLPVAYIKNYVNPALAPDMDQYLGKFISLYHFLENHYHIQLTDADETISAISADFVDSKILNVSAGSPLLRSRRMTYSQHTLVERSESKLVAFKYEYQVHLKGRGNF